MENIRTNPNGVEYKHMTTTEILTKELTNFIESLRFAGYNIGATQYIAAQDLILTLAAQSKLPSELTELRQYLAPILCHSPKEQEEFDTHFNQWVKQFPQTKILLSPQTKTSPEIQITSENIATAKTEVSPLNNVESELRTIKKGSTFWKWGLIAFAMVFLFSIFVYWSDITHLLKGDEIVQPIQPKSDEIVQPKPTLPDKIQPVSPSFIDRLPSLPVGFTLLSPFLILLLWLLWWWYRIQLFLARQSTKEPPDIKKLFLQSIDDKFFKSVNFARTAQQLRKHISIPANLLDVDATVDKTIQAGGWFTPIASTIKIRPQYLALIDRTTFNDHQTQLVNSLINKLVDDDVLVTRYYFDTVPRRCYPQQSKQAPFTLPELAQHYPDHRLLIFSDGNGLVNPITGKVVNWIEQFSWSQKALFTLESPEQWGYREQVLDGADFLILPANEEGLQGLVEKINTGTWQPEPTDSFTGEFPEYLQERPRRWLEHHAPDAPVLTELLKQVRDFLGDAAYYWFSACAIYPELRWQLTLYLGKQLNSLREERLAKLARLPWFRYGYMPDWLRERLVKDLSLEQEKDIRLSLQSLLLTAQDGQMSDFNLEIAKPQHLSALVQRLLPKWTKQAPNNSPLHDHVFMTFMEDKLAVKIPKISRNLFVKPSIFLKPSTISLRPLLLIVVLLVLFGLTYEQLKQNLSYLFEQISPPIPVKNIPLEQVIQDDKNIPKDNQIPPDKIAKTYLQLGVEYMRRGKNDIALTKLKKALQVDNNYSTAHNAIAVLYERLGLNDEATQHYQKAMALKPNGSDIHNNYGQFLCKQKQWKEADEHFLKALENPAYSTPEITYTNAGLCALRNNNTVKAETYLRTALQKNPKFPKALYQMANLSYEQKHYVQARDYLQRYLEVAEHTPKALWLGIRIERVLNNKPTFRTSTIQNQNKIVHNFLPII